MKLAIIYDPKCSKLTKEAYSQTYRDMFLALVNRYEDVKYITQDCSAKDIEADHIVFFDIHSSHHVKIDGIENHPAVKFEYFNDPWQTTLKGVDNTNNQPVHKLNAKDRSERAMKRGIDYIICPYENMYYQHIAPYLDEPEKMLLWFPIAPDERRFDSGSVLLKTRKPEVLLNGHTWRGMPGFRPYKFRTWAFEQGVCECKQHNIADKSTPAGIHYPRFLAGYAGAAALCNHMPCPKYSEIPLAGCVTFAQFQLDYKKMGFDDSNCVFVTKKNFKDAINDFKAHVEDYQEMATKGRELMLNNWTARHFADCVYGKRNRT